MYAQPVTPCQFGDFLGYINDATCQETVAVAPWHCYDLQFRELCCQSCEDIKSADNKGITSSLDSLFNDTCYA